jgi:fluoride exporter
MKLVAICLAGAAGTLCRYLISVAALRYLNPAFPFGTLLVNLLGSFFLGLLMQVSLTSPNFSPTLRLALSVGFLGGFTTYSSFNQETLQLVQTGQGLKALLHVATTLVGCLTAGWVGSAVGGRLLAH